MRGCQFDDALVHDYQDTVRLQHAIIPGAWRGLTVLGDDAGGVSVPAHSRRDGAHTLDQFSPPAMIIALERNHRST
jgi:hypothetical protein